MSDNKKYYYLRLKENFFDTDEMKIIECRKNGYIYSNILMKLYLKSLKSEGRLMLNSRIPYSVEMIANITNHDVDNVKVALSMFQELGLIEILDNGAIYMSDIQVLIGQSSTEADRVKKYRQKIKEEKKTAKIESKNKNVQMYDICTSEHDEIGLLDMPIDENSKKVYECTPEIELEIELDNNKGIKIDELVEEIEDEQPSEKEKAPTITTTINSFTSNLELRQSLKDYLIMRKKIKKPVATVRTINDRLNELKLLSDDIDIQIQIVNQSVDNCWQKFYALKNQPQVQKKQPVPKIEDILPEGYDYLPEDVKKETYEHYQQVIQKGIEDGIYE